MEDIYSKNGKTVTVCEHYEGGKRHLKLYYWIDSKPRVDGCVRPVSDCTTDRGAMIKINKFLNS